MPACVEGDGGNPRPDMTMGRRARADMAVTADESESTLFDHHDEAATAYDQEAKNWANFNQAIAAAKLGKDRWAEFYEALLAVEQPEEEEQSDVTAASGSTEAVNEVAAAPASAPAICRA